MTRFFGEILACHYLAVFPENAVMKAFPEKVRRAAVKVTRDGKNSRIKIP
jgi:hypothetical protein